MIVPATHTSGMYPDSPARRPMGIDLEPTLMQLRNTMMLPFQHNQVSPVERGDELQCRSLEVYGSESMSADIPAHVPHLVDLPWTISSCQPDCPHPQTTPFGFLSRRERPLDAEFPPPRDLAYQSPQRRFSMLWRPSLCRTISYETWVVLLSTTPACSCRTDKCNDRWICFGFEYSHQLVRWQVGDIPIC